MSEPEGIDPIAPLGGVAPLAQVGRLWRNVVAHRDWHYRARAGRDARLDLLRGLCVTMLVIDHIGGWSPLLLFTGGGEFYVTAAEGFVSISGFLFGTVYWDYAEKSGLGVVWRRALKRALMLYLVLLGSTLVVVLEGTALGLPRWRPVHSAGELGDIVWQVATFRLWLHHVRILGMYTLLLLMAPAGLWLLRVHKTWLLLLVSWLVYAAYQVSPPLLGRPFPIDAYFHPYSYQIIFVHFMVLGCHRDWVRRALARFRSTTIFAVGLAGTTLLVGVYLIQRFGVPHLLPKGQLPWTVALFEREFLRPGRLLALALVTPVVWTLITRLWEPIQTDAGSVATLFGRHSLACYAVHLPIVVLFDRIAQWWVHRGLLSAGLNTVAQLLGVLLVWTAVRGGFSLSRWART